MKIAILHVGDLEHLALGGVDQYIKNIIRDRKDNKITIFGTCVKGKYDIGKVYNIKNGNLEYDFFPISDDSMRPLTLGYLLSERKYLNKILEYDVVYAQRIETVLPFVLKKHKTPIIQVVHGSSYYTTMHWNKLKSWIYEFFEKITIGIADETNVVLMRSEFGVPYYKKKYKKYANKIGYAKIPVNTDIFRQLDKLECKKKLELPQDDFIVLYGGRVEDNPKRVLLIPQIIQKALQLHKNIHLVVVGDGTDLEKLRLDLNNSLPQEAYTVVGYLEDRDKFVQYLNASDANINISEFEGTCTSSLEAIACEAKIISTDVGDIRLFVKEGKDGFVIANCKDTIVDDSVNAIISLTENKIEMSGTYKNYDCHQVVAELFAHFEALLDE